MVYDLKPRLKHFLWAIGQPTRVVSMYQLRAFRPHWATVWTQRKLTKSQEYQVLDEYGITIPKWTTLTRDKMPDLSGFSDFVVTKPDWGCCGALIRVRKQSRLKWEKPVVEKAGESISDDWIVQEYIHTDRWPTSYRVGTVFGEPIYAWHHVGNKSVQPFERKPEKASDFAGRTIVASARGCTYDLEIPEDILELARNTHAAFPTVPLLGVDIVRDCDTKKLYVLDINTSGNTFHLTSDTGKDIMGQFGLDLLGQFGGAKAIARGIAKRVEKEATELVPKTTVEEEPTDCLRTKSEGALSR